MNTHKKVFKTKCAFCNEDMIYDVSTTVIHNNHMFCNPDCFTDWLGDECRCEPHDLVEEPIYYTQCNCGFCNHQRSA